MKAGTSNSIVQALGQIERMQLQQEQQKLVALQNPILTSWTSLQVRTDHREGHQVVTENIVDMMVKLCCSAKSMPQQSPYEEIWPYWNPSPGWELQLWQLLQAWVSRKWCRAIRAGLSISVQKIWLSGKFYTSKTPWHKIRTRFWNFNNENKVMHHIFIVTLKISVNILRPSHSKCNPQTFFPPENFHVALETHNVPQRFLAKWMVPCKHLIISP